MWLWFAVAAASQIAILYLPGFLMLRSAGTQRLTAICLAPLLSCAILVGIANIFSLVGVFCNWASVGLTAMAICAGAWGARNLYEKRRGPSPETPLAHLPINPKHAILYVVFGIAVGVFALLMPLGDPTNFIQEIDNKTHLAIVRQFVETGNWSTVSGGFYPCVWHTIGALSVSLCGADIVIAQNALNYVFAAIVFPLAMLGFLTLLDPNDKKTLFYGAIITSSFAAFPIGIIYFGPLFANVAGFSMFPSLACFFILMIESFKEKRGRLAIVAFFILASIASIVAHPNTLFLAIVFLAPYCLQQIFVLNSESGNRMRGVALCAAFLIALLVVWCGFYKAPFMQAAINAAWASYTDIGHALFDLAVFSMARRSAQIALAILIAIGFVKTVITKRHGWLAVSYAIIALLFVVDISTDGQPKLFLTGFWYADPCRISACLVIAAIPLASIGFATIDSALRKAIPKLDEKASLAKLLTAALVVAFIFVNFNPLRAFGGYRESDFFAFEGIRQGLYLNAHGDSVIYNESEREFVRDAVEITGDALVINSNDDGTLFAYGADGLNTLYRVPSVWTADSPERSEGESYEEWIIRTHLDEYATNEDVQRAVDDLGAEYVIQLDADGAIDTQRKLLGYTDKKWPGIDAINEQTPGFELVLERDDMKLYRIEKEGA